MKLKGFIIHGEKKARTLGFPTANIEVGSSDLETGIYAGIVSLQGKDHHAALYVPGGNMIEAFLFDFSGEAYGRDAEISLRKKIREKRAFKDDQDAIQQIAKDVEEIKTCLRES